MSIFRIPWNCQYAACVGVKPIVRDIITEWLWQIRRCAELNALSYHAERKCPLSFCPFVKSPCFSGCYSIIYLYYHYYILEMHFNLRLVIEIYFVTYCSSILFSYTLNSSSLQVLVSLSIFGVSV